MNSQSANLAWKVRLRKRTFNAKLYRTKYLLELVHSDVCGPMSIQARGGFEYFITFADDFSRFGYVYLMKWKFEVFEKFKEFRAKVENQLGKHIKAFDLIVMANTFLGISRIT